MLAYAYGIMLGVYSMTTEGTQFIAAFASGMLIMFGALNGVQE